MNDDTLDGFIELFQGGTRAWGAVHGECIKEPLTKERWKWHLVEGSIGVYPLTPKEDVPVADRPRGFASDSLVRWGCTDIDNAADPESTLPLAKNIRTALAYMGMVSWIERTKGKGYHVWLFLDHWQRPAWVRNVLLLAHKAAGVTPTEVNPKQVTLGQTKNGLGNYVNTVYARSHAPTSNEILEARRLVMAGWVDGGGGFLSCPTSIGQATRGRPCAVHDGPRRGGEGQGGRGAGSPCAPQDFAREEPAAPLEAAVRVGGPAERGGDGAGVGVVPVVGRAQARPGEELVRGLAHERGPVRAPSTYKRVILCADGLPLTVEEFVGAALSTRVSAETIETWAGRYVAPQAPRRPNVDITPSGELEAILGRLKPLSRKIHDEGPLEPRDGKPGRGRYLTLQRLAFEMADQGGFTPSEMFAVLWSADERMADPKFHARADGEEQVKLMVARALTPRS